MAMLLHMISLVGYSCDVDALLCITVLCFMSMLLQVKVLSPQEILFRKEDKRAVVVDVRPADDYDEVTNPARAADCTSWPFLSNVPPDIRRLGPSTACQCFSRPVNILQRYRADSRTAFAARFDLGPWEVFRNSSNCCGP